MKKVADLRGLRLFGDPTGDEVSFPEVIPPEKNGAVAPSGEEEASAAGKKESETRQKFRALMEGEYKQEFTAYFNEVFARRFKEQKGQMEELRLARTVVEAAAKRYGVSEIGQLLNTIRADSAVSAPTAATTEGPTDKPSEKNTVDIAAGEAAEKTGAAELDRRIREAVERAVADTRAQTERELTQTYLARGFRPSENALSALQSTAHTGASRLTRAERAAVALRAAMGERIEL